ncbi:MAG: hypothetical protein IKA91_03915, partial [Bacteroidaceae bacterium]|nr:hypothetical protein [Bacteroidaceae bacterium]
MKKYIITIYIVLLTLFGVKAQVPVERIVSDIEYMAQQCEILSAEECSIKAQEWVSAIPSSDMLAYASQAQKVLYPPYSTLNGRIAYR